MRRVDGLLVGSIGELAMIAPIWIFLADLPAWALVAAMFASGLANGLVNAPIWTIFTVRTPPALRPKAWAAIIATTSLLGPLVLLATGLGPRLARPDGDAARDRARPDVSRRCSSLPPACASARHGCVADRRCGV